MPSVLFVCTANRIRSPLAEHLFRRQLEAGVHDSAAWRVASAGTWTKPGLPAMPLAQQAAAELGLDLSTHRSQPIDDIALEDYGLIITMEQGQQEAIRFEFFAVGARVQVLAQLAHDLVYDVADPVGRPLAAYRTTAREIEQLLNAAQSRIIQMAQVAAI